jgi:hypothetical protein
MDAARTVLHEGNDDALRGFTKRFLLTVTLQTSYSERRLETIPRYKW